MGDLRPKGELRQKRLRRVIVDPSLTIQPELQVPQPSFGSLANLTPFVEGFFHHPSTLNPDLAKETYREAGFRLVYSSQALDQIREHRSAEFEYDPDGFVWVR